ncbi:pirin family protein [Streptomyces sp. NPDC102360]|uniref:pirin family protein n=1 Tax=Streptomyces sp. NPDC102360 TaxID=3366160 RepID=UPI0037FA1CC5
MSAYEQAPVEAHRATVTRRQKATGGRQVEVLSAREVPLGGPRAMVVRRTLPQRERSLIGAWCFADHYGPEIVAVNGGMDVAPHPHIGLQTASWLFDGEIEHRDSLGTHAMVRPGELNLMTAGRGISHSEVSTPDTTILRGVQLWIALPDEHRDVAPAFRHHAPATVALDGAEARVFLGTLAGDTSPVPTYSPLLGAELVLEPGAHTTLAVDPSFEHGVLVDEGAVRVEGTAVPGGQLGYLAPGGETITLANDAGSPARLLLLGGTPFGEEIVMWWNFIGRSHEDIVTAREEWKAGAGRFGTVVGHPGERLPAPELPNSRLKSRGNRSPR